jgi:hypothetical protein
MEALLLIPILLSHVLPSFPWKDYCLLLSSFTYLRSRLLELKDHLDRQTKPEGVVDILNRPVHWKPGFTPQSHQYYSHSVGTLETMVKVAILVLNIRAGWESEHVDPGIAWNCLAFAISQA